MAKAKVRVKCRSNEGAAPSAAAETVSQLQEALSEAEEAGALRAKVGDLEAVVEGLRRDLARAQREVVELRGAVDFTTRDERLLAVHKGEIQLDRDFRSGEVRVRVRCGRQRAFGRTIAECLAALRPTYEKE